MKKGVVITLDSLVAFLLAIAIGAIVLSTLSQMTFSVRDDSLTRLAQEYALAAEYSFDPYTSGDEFVDNIVQDPYCASITLFDTDGAVDDSFTKTGCVDNADEVGVAYRGIVDIAGIEALRMRVWLDE